MERKFPFNEGEHYHVFNRGIEKRLIFQDKSDSDRFQMLLYLANGTRPIVFSRVRGLPLSVERGETLTDILCYSLMPNHFHLVARERRPGGLSKFMGKLSTSYSMYFNTKYERSGALLCHPFRARHIDSDEYFRWVISYVHLNPLDISVPQWEVKGFQDTVRAESFLKSFSYSSYGDYFDEVRPESKIINKEALPIDIADLESVEKMLEEYRSASVYEGNPRTMA